MTCIASCPSTASIPQMFSWRFYRYNILKAIIIILIANRKDALTQTSKTSVISFEPCPCSFVSILEDGSCCCLRDYHVNLWVCNHVIYSRARARGPLRGRGSILRTRMLYTYYMYVYIKLRMHVRMYVHKQTVQCCVDSPCAMHVKTSKLVTTRSILSDRRYCHFNKEEKR